MPPKQRGKKIEYLVKKARAGDRAVLEEIVLAIQDRIYNLALRMLFIPADAEDATQEILVKVITHLGTFKGESRFDTWVYRIAANHLLTLRKSRAERWQVSFDTCREAIEAVQSEEMAGGHYPAEQGLMVEETRLACVQYLLLCLSRELRLAVILDGIFGVGPAVGADILGLTPAAYRQRLSRGRKQLLGFLAVQCGLVARENPCRCETLAAYHVKKKHLDPANPLYAVHPCRGREKADGGDLLRELDLMERAAALIRSHPDYAAPEHFVASMRHLIESKRFQLLEGH
jgi:RNA polymerase sigma factor (sigma-70 family)